MFFLFLPLDGVGKKWFARLIVPGASCSCLEPQEWLPRLARPAERGPIRLDDVEVVDGGVREDVTGGSRASGPFELVQFRLDAVEDLFAVVDLAGS